MISARTFLLSSVGLGIAIWAAVHLPLPHDSRASAMSTETQLPAGSGDPGPATGDARFGEMERLRGEVALLRAQVSSVLEAQAHPPSPPITPDGTKDLNPPMMVSGRDPGILATEKQVRQGYIAGLESTFRGELSDPKWAASTMSAVQAALKTDAVALSARDMECRSQTCRLEISDDGSGRVNSALPILATHLANLLPYVDADNIKDGSGETTVVLYLANSRPHSPPPGP